ncbi:MAG: NAD(P)/FAD-dependent oxidoreductase [Candidatus Gastranaerophilales bacterium]|nr:NAD(P)/FAD-dependent oxidoreductase [Candidatus Gastranaerophilales bacterium]
MERVNVGVVGGGAAGLMAAITAARRGAQVTLFEQNDRVGKKLLMTGNGRCNLGNRELSAAAYHGAKPDWIQARLNCFDTEDMICFFQGIGLLFREREGLLYPASNQASAVLDVLRFELKSLGVGLETGCRVERIELISSDRQKTDKKIRLYAGGRAFSFDRVILACGGCAAPATGSDGSGYALARRLGHTIIPTVPALVQMRCRETYFKAVSGVRADAEITLWQKEDCVAKEQGELQFTDYGISGIPVFQLSRQAAYLLRKQEEVSVHIKLLSGYGEEDLERLFKNRLILMADRTVEEFFTGILHKKLMTLFVKMAGLKPAMSVEQAGRQALSSVLSLCMDWEVKVNAVNSFDHAQVTAGGIPHTEVTEQLESRLVSGVYFAGEILDVDGKCGGYNLHWAWCSGYLAGTAAAGEEK